MQSIVKAHRIGTRGDRRPYTTISVSENGFLALVLRRTQYVVVNSYIEAGSKILVITDAGSMWYRTASWIRKTAQGNIVTLTSLR